MFLVGDFNFIPFSLLYNILSSGSANFKNSPIKEYSGQSLAMKIKKERLFERFHFLALTKIHQVNPNSKKPALNDEFLVNFIILCFWIFFYSKNLQL